MGWLEIFPCLHPANLTILVFFSENRTAIAASMKCINRSVAVRASALGTKHGAGAQGRTAILASVITVNGVVYKSRQNNHPFF